MNLDLKKMPTLILLCAWLCELVIHKCIIHFPSYTESPSRVESLITSILDRISDDKLREVAFSVHLKRVALLSTSTNVYDPVVYEQVKFAVQVLLELFNKSSHSLKQVFFQHFSNELHLMAFAPKTVWSCLELYSMFNTMLSN